MADERRADTFQVTPEEARFLHRFVRRAVLPWIAGVGALAGLALGAALSPAPPAVPVAAEPGAEATAAQAELRAEIDQLREELTALRAGAGTATREKDRDAQRLRDDFEERLASLEASLAKRPEPASPGAAGEPEVSAGDLSSIRDRVNNLELRLYDLGRPAEAPAAPAPADSPR